MAQGVSGMGRLTMRKSFKVWKLVITFITHSLIRYIESTLHSEHLDALHLNTLHLNTLHLDTER